MSTTTADSPAAAHSGKDYTLRGTVYCSLSAVAYTLFNICLRDVAEKEDPAWVNCVQASVGMAVFGCCLLWQRLGGRRALPPWRELLALTILGLITQAGGVLFIWAMGVVGVGVTSTLQMGVMLASSAVLGLVVLGERVHWQQIIAIVLITAAVAFFSIGSHLAGESDAAPDAAPAAEMPAAIAAAEEPPPQKYSPQTISLGIAAGILAGLAFGMLTVGIRKTVTSETSPEAVVFIINAMGTLAFGPWCLYSLGLDSLLQTSLRNLSSMVGAGMMNLTGFLLVTLSLRLITVVRVNVVNNGLTMVLTVAAGLALFAEPWNWALALGIALSMAGILLISLAQPAEEQTASAAA